MDSQDSKYNKSKARKDAIKPALAFFTGMGSVFLALHYVAGNRRGVRPPTQAQTALASLTGSLRGAELPEAFRSFQGPSESQLRAARYILGPVNSDGCPEGYDFLADPESCEIAASVMKHRYNGDQRIAAEISGCVYRTPDRDLMWNQEEGGQPSAARQRVCVERASLEGGAAAPPAAAPAVPAPAPEAEAVVKSRSQDGAFIMTDIESNSCPSANRPLQSKEECEEAAKSFGKKFMSETFYQELEPRGCVFRVPDQDLFWNVDAEGSPHENRQVVCLGKAAKPPALSLKLPDSDPAPAPAPAPSDALDPEMPAPVASAATYVLGDLGETECPAGSVALAEMEDCEVAAKVLSKEFVELNEAEGDPRGCQFRPPDQDVYFNTHSRGAPNPGRQPVCREDAAAAAQRTTQPPKFNFEYVMGEPETTDCPAGATYIETADECGAAAKKLGKMFLGEQNPAEMDPKGCQFRIPDQDIYFNPHPEGATHADRQPVCRS